MAEFRSSIPLPYVPDDLTIPQFLLDDYKHPIGEMRKGNNDVWFIDDSTGKRFSYGEGIQLKARTNYLVLGLASFYNILDNDVVLIISPNHIDYIVATWALQRLGAVVATANPLFTTEELVQLLDMCKVTKIITDERFLTSVGPAADAAGIPTSSILLFDISEIRTGVPITTISDLVNEGQKSTDEVPGRTLEPGGARKKIALIFFSSGTTGKPKAVALSHYAVIASIIQMTALQRENGKPRGPGKWALLSEDVITGLLPFSHVYGLVANVYWACFLGLIVDVFPKFTLAAFLTSITKYRIAHLYLVPPHVVSICKDPSIEFQDYSHVKLIFTGAASLSVPLMHKAIDVFSNASIAQGYGMTEIMVAALQSPMQRINDGSCGQLLPGIVAKVVRADGTLARPNETGELVMSSPSNALGYIGNDEATKATFVDGWVHSGDEVRVTETGDIFVVERLKELINVQGIQVAPAELEDHLMAHPHVADACVIPVPDEHTGELPLAFVVPSVAAKKLMKNGMSEDDVKTEIQKHVSDHKVKDKWLAGGVRFIDSVPKSPSGKILRRVLRESLRNNGIASAA
ncbi:amp dependent CoA ligase [Collybia nuda]|uniref:Amp dependent CoA ligase n=1 Tax=Collybia nuda TaxID=64659 RepID=A0A9P5Y7C5_9AGAR|nr:amp dependent CoA ligase [Collybia nuda]